MNEIIANINIKLMPSELLSYFSVELICILGIVLNFIISFFILKNLKLKRLSDILTCSIFCINSIILTAFLFQGESFSIRNDLVVFNNNTIFFKLFINIFAIFFILITYKFTRKSKYRVPAINSILIAIIMLTGLLLTSDNFTFTYILLEGIIILIYKYASKMRLKTNSIYSLEYITISFCATFLFVMFYLMDYLVDDVLQKSIVQSCMALSLLLKIGLFPIFNYSIDKKCRSNIAYSVLLFCFLPFAGAVAFNKIISLCMYNEVCQLSSCVFVLLCAFLASINAFKTKNLTGYIISIGQFYTCFYILNSIFTKDLNPGFLIIAICLMLCLYSMIRIYKNKNIYRLIFSMLIIATALLVPIFGFDILYNIYVFDKIGFYTLNTVIFCNVLLIIKTLKLLESFYKINIKF
ncbi:MAG: hypothetical protein IJ877_02330 [Candidatus Gastranaerophilales bacterium]|nr:hypothetical protein [Candidatus Gastranaerophilales bacterium]